MSLDFLADMITGRNVEVPLDPALVKSNAAAKPRLKLGYGGEDFSRIAIQLPNAYITSFPNAIHPRTRQVEDLVVEACVQKSRIGERLFRSLAVYALAGGHEQLGAHVINPNALKMLCKVVDEDSIRLFDEVNGVDTEIPISIDQSIDSIQRAQDLADAYEALDSDPEMVDVGFDVLVNIQGIEGEKPILGGL